MEQKPNKTLTFFQVAALYVGALMGAGFSSGREGWQFFGVFGGKGYLGLVIAGALFILLGVMVSYLARALGTSDMGAIIVCVDSPLLISAVGYIMAGILYTMIIAMSAAGGSFLAQVFGLPQAVGGIVIVILVIITVLGDFDRISGVLRFIAPILFVVDVGVCILVICSDIGQSGATSGFPASAMASGWISSAIIFVAYNMLGMIPIVASSSVRARSSAHGMFGAGLGGLLLTILTFMLITALRKDMAYSNGLDMPMLGLAGRLSPVLTVVFGVILFAAIYSVACSTYYGFSTKIQAGPKKKWILIIGAVVGFACSLTGFKVIVEYLYPMQGYLGLLFITSISIHFFRVLLCRRREKGGPPTERGAGTDDAAPGADGDGPAAADRWEDPDADIFALPPDVRDRFTDFPGHDRTAYPDGLVRVTAGQGGEAVLILEGERTALYDCGMAYCHRALIRNIETALTAAGKPTLDVILLSHSHYDHIGALPYLLQRWPEAQVCGAAKAAEVFGRPGAKRLMRELGENARDLYSTSTESVLTEPLRVDRIVGDGDCIDLGSGVTVQVLATPGHTDCSLTYVLEPRGLMFTSESTGVLISPRYVHTAILKGYQKSLDSTRKCRAYGAKQLVVMHYGIAPAGFVEDYFDLYLHFAENEKQYILHLYDSGMSRAEILEAFVRRYWSPERGKSQPLEAFRVNAGHTIDHILEVFRDARQTDPKRRLS